MLNILVTGANGQLGSEIKELSEARVKMSLPDIFEATHPRAQNKFFFTDKDTLDITNPHAINDFIEKNSINTIINCAAYTAVDKAESDIEMADKINHLALKYLAQISKEKNIQLIHISTDYVFDGKAHLPYTENDPTNPQSVYGKTKLEGEKAMQEINPSNSIIIRTSWVYSSYGANFVKTMLRLGKEKESLGVIYDQVGTPTYARDLAQAILHIVDCFVPRNDEISVIANEMEQSTNVQMYHYSNAATVIANEMKQSTNVQMYHYSNEGVTSWYDFAKEIMRMAKLSCQINPIETKEYPTPAKRPHYSLLNKAKIKKEFELVVPYWKDSLDACLKKMGERK